MWRLIANERGVVPLVAAAGVAGKGVGFVSGLFGGHRSGIATHAERFREAQASGNTTLAASLAQQAWAHVQRNDPGASGLTWPGVWAQMVASGAGVYVSGSAAPPVPSFPEDIPKAPGGSMGLFAKDAGVAPSPSAAGQPPWGILLLVGALAWASRSGRGGGK